MQCRPVGKRKKGFGDVPCDRIKPRSFARSQDNGFHRQGYLEACARNRATFMRRTAYGWVVFLAVATGCGGDVRADIPDPLKDLLPPSPSANFDVYQRAAEEMEQKAEKVIGRTTWSPDQQDAMVAAAAGPLALIAGFKDVEFGRTSSEAMGFRKHARGWRAMGRALQWMIERQVRSGEHAAAIESFSTAILMAEALGTSDAEDADMGVEILDDCITAIWPGLPRFGAGELRSLSALVAEAVAYPPDPEASVQHELYTVLQGVAWLADNYEKRDFEAIRERLGRFAEPAVKYLRELSEEEAEKQVAFFKSLVGELHKEANSNLERLVTAPYQWTPIDHGENRPWWRFTDTFCTTLRRYVERRALTRTRLQLLGLDAALLADYKATGATPKSLRALGGSMHSDPYSGSDFVFIPRGVDYKLYSVGPNLREDGGGADDVGLGR